MASTISTTLTKEIVLGSSGAGVYVGPLTITATGRINAPAPNSSFQAAGAIYANAVNASILNNGIVNAAVPATGSYAAPTILSANVLTLTNTGTIAGQSGVYLNAGGTVTNSGSIAGTDSRLNDGYGVRLVNGTLVNSGTVYGKRYGAFAENASRITNSGLISGAVGVRQVTTYVAVATSDSLSNTGRISGSSIGVTETNAFVTNSGTITGGTYGIRVSWGGSVSNSGRITAGVDGVLIFNQQYKAQYETTFSNSGTILGHYFGAAINFAVGSNTAKGLISGTSFGVGVGDNAYFYNAGTLYGLTAALVVESGGNAVNAGTATGNKIGLWEFSNSNATNAAGGYVYSLNTAAVAQGAYLVNDGAMVGEKYGLELFSGGIAVNDGSITSALEGVYLSSLSATSSPDFLVNQNYVYGKSIGIILKNGTVYNYGTVQAGQIGATLVSGVSLDNFGYVYGPRYGVQLRGGNFTNSGVVVGKVNGVQLTGGTIMDSGTISGVKNAIYGTSIALTIDPGAVFKGNVTDTSKVGRLTLGGSTPATLSGVGNSINGFATLSFASGAHWLVSGTTAALSTRSISSIGGFEQGDTIVLTGFSMASESFVSGRGLILNGNAVTLGITGSFTTANFSVTNSGGNTVISLLSGAPCFVQGTRILTPRGEIAVEALRVGDKVITQDGADAPVCWIGRRAVALRGHPYPERVRPVCIAAGALGDGEPRRDLWVSPDHALWIEGVLVPAQCLLNGLNIVQGDAARVVYYHLELPAHAVIFAEGAAAESYLETGNRAAFEGVDGMVLHPDFSAKLRREKSCAELLLDGERLEEIRRGILARYQPETVRLDA